MKPTVRPPFHVHALQQELHRRKEKNPRYSLRAFATHLEVHPSALSRILSGKQELSLSASLLIIEKITLTDSEKMRFIDSLAEEKYLNAMTTLTAALNVPIKPSQKVCAPLSSEDFKFKSLANNLPHLIWCLSRKADTITFRNLAYRTYVGLSDSLPEICIVDEWFKYLHPSEASKSKASIMKGVASESLFVGQCGIRGVDGKYSNFEYKYWPVRNLENIIIGWIGLAQATASGCPPF